MAIAIDPICGMKVDTKNPPGGKSDYQENIYYFCAPACKTAFDRDPQGHLKKGPSAPGGRKTSFLARLFGRKE